MLERAIEIAVETHKGQIDKGGSPYILHPLRGMMSVHGESEKIVGVLHDVVEDSDWTFEDLLADGFSSEVIEALKSVTKISDNEGYDSFIQRAIRNPIGHKVKIADLRDNLDVTRISDITDKDVKRINKYKKALKILTA